jgi:hypothetical protein
MVWPIELGNKVIFVLNSGQAVSEAGPSLNISWEHLAKVGMILEKELASWGQMINRIKQIMDSSSVGVGWTCSHTFSVHPFRSQVRGISRPGTRINLSGSPDASSVLSFGAATPSSSSSLLLYRIP